MPMAGKETYFNSRRSARGDRAYRRGWSISRYFNSRPSARGDRAAERRRLHPRISIHAPPRGATSRALLVARKLHLFQFTPLREGRLLALTCLPMAFYFNSRPSARGDHAAGFAGFGVCISIHAPPRGATSAALFEQHRQIFQFTPLREGRRARYAQYRE